LLAQLPLRHSLPLRSAMATVGAHVNASAESHELQKMEPPYTNFTTSVANPVAIANLRADITGTNTLANPRIRVRNREKAKVHIGDKLPVFTTTSTAKNTPTTYSVN
jgi:type II secretory pathway component GspD/PulD (secretin)